MCPVAKRRRQVSSERGSAPVEFVLVSVLVVAVVLGVVQLALALHVRNTLQDAASEGARWAALADSNADRGVARTRELITLAVGDQYAQDISVTGTDWLGRPAVAVTVRATLPLVGLFGIPSGLEVTGHSSVEVVAQ